MEHCKLQIGCIMVVGYIAFLYYHGTKLTDKKYKWEVFDDLLNVTILNLIFDAITVYTVNHLNIVPLWLNHIVHLIFLISIDVVIYVIFVYILVTTDVYPRKKWLRNLLAFPLATSVFIAVVSIGSLEYRVGKITNYSMGISAYTCYAMVAVYLIMTLISFFRKWNYIEKNKRASIALFLIVLSGLTTYQMVFPEALLTSVGFTILVVGIYINQENPSVKELAHYHHEMVMGFATLVENRDDSTGGHIRRTSLYAEALARALRKGGHYRSILTKDYISNLRMAAPMHDVGKISVPDAILQKPGKLTEDEFSVMKTHAESGGKIIKETFGKLENAQYMEMAYQVANFHHERWDGTGYPQGLAGEDIPLCARIMAVADVFDAVSEKRCYREALPLETCFKIIEDGRGTSFEPLLVDIFLSIQEEIMRIHKNV